MDRERLEAEVDALREQVAAQAVEIDRLTRMVAELTRRLDKGSKNSSSPPSADSPRHQAEATKTRADRRAEAKANRRAEVERNRGKQPGAPGQNLSMRSDPDETVDHEPMCCVSCGDDLGDAPVEGTNIGDLTELPFGSASFQAPFQIGFAHTPFPGDWRTRAQIEDEARSC